MIFPYFFVVVDSLRYQGLAFEREKLVQVIGKKLEHFFDAHAREGFDVRESTVEGSFDYAKWAFTLAANLRDLIVALFLFFSQRMPTGGAVHRFIENASREMRAKVPFVAIHFPISLGCKANFCIMQARGCCFYFADELVFHVKLDVIFVPIMHLPLLDGE